MDTLDPTNPPIATEFSHNREGDTEFVSTCAAYEALSEADKKLIENLQVVHTMAAYGSKVPAPVTQEFVESWAHFPSRTLPMRRVPWGRRSC